MEKPMKIEPGQYVVDTDNSKAYRCLYGARRDISIAQAMISHCCDQNLNGREADAEEAFWTAALIRYSRARKGYAKRKEHLLAWENLSPFFSKIDIEMRMLRDKLYAHGIGIGEDYQVFATIGESFAGDARVYAVGICTRRISSPGSDKAKEFLLLLDHLSEKISRLEHFQHSKLLTELQSYPSNEVTSQGIYKPQLNFDDSSSLYRREKNRYSDDI
jgi:hypothetical protein